MLPPGFLQDLLSRVDIVELVGRHVTLKKAGINYKGLCPFHGEKTASFTVSPTRQTYHCFGCGAHGDAIRFLTEHAGMGFMDAVRELAQGAGLVVPTEELSAGQRAALAQQKEREAGLLPLLARAADHYREQLRQSPRAIDYLKGRGLSGQVAARYGLGYAPSGWRALASCFPRYDDPQLVEAGLVIVQDEVDPESRRYDRFRDRIMFPIRNVRGEVIGFGGRVLDQGEPKYLNSPETPVFFKGRELYGLHEARQAIRRAGHVLVVEGYMDVVALAQLGLENAVATLGTACTPEHIQKLLRFTDEVVFSFDGDAAGRRAAQRAMEAALPHASDTRRIRFLYLPPEHDPDSFVRARGRDAFTDEVARAVPLSRQLLEASGQGCDLSTPEGRARMLAQAQPWWAQLPAGALKAQMLAEFAGAGAMSVAALQAIWEDAPAVRRGAAAMAPAAQSTNGMPGRIPLAPRGGGRTRAPRQPPQGPADHAVRALVQNTAWWDQLGAEDHALLLELGPPHGELVAWLDRHLAEHGPVPWAQMAPILASQPFGPWATRLLERGEAVIAETEPLFSELRTALDRLMVEHLKARETDLIAQAGVDPQARAHWREIHDRRRQLESALLQAAREAERTDGL